MTTPIRLPNGEIIEIATSDPKQAAAAAQRVWAKRSAPKLPKAPPKGRGVLGTAADALGRSEEHTSELQSLMRISYAVFCLKKKTKNKTHSKRHYKHL